MRPCSAALAETFPHRLPVLLLDLLVGVELFGSQHSVEILDGLLPHGIEIPA